MCHAISSHIEPLATKLGFPHILGKTYTCDRRIWVGDSINTAGRSCGDQASGTDRAMGSTRGTASTSPSHVSVAPPTSFCPTSTESSARVSSPPYSHAQSAGILSSSVCTSSHGASASPGSNVDPSADPVTHAKDQASVKVTIH